jgi:hypothetical protein
MKKVLTYNVAIKDYLRCVQFAHDSIQTNLDAYAIRNQKNVHKIFNDIVVGKIGEFAVYQFLKEKHELDEPDLKIYSKEKKSFDADLKAAGLNIHVKAQAKAQGETYGTSWSFHPTDKLITSPSDSDVIFLCSVDDLSVDILSYDKASFYLDLYDEPVKESLKKTKKVIYFTKVIKKLK